MSEKTSLPRVSKVKSTAPVSDLDAFDMMSRFLAAEKAKQLSHDFSGQTFLASSSQTWNDLRLACNSLLDDNDPRREPVAGWKDETGDLTTTATTSPSPSKTEIATTTPATEKSIKKESRRSEKKEKKEAKKAKKEVKKAKKSAKKEKKDSSKKRKHEEEA
jgi:predicted GNAT family acetyltransferase